MILCDANKSFSMLHICAPPSEKGIIPLDLQELITSERSHGTSDWESIVANVVLSLDQNQKEAQMLQYICSSCYITKMTILVDNTSLFSGEEEKPPSPVKQPIRVIKRFHVKKKVQVQILPSHSSQCSKDYWVYARLYRALQPNLQMAPQ